MPANTISFKVRNYADYKTQATHLSSPDRFPSHLGMMYHARFNPAVAMMSGANENLLTFCSLFRKWAWFGSRFACVPVARGLVDPAHLAKEFGSGSGTIGMDPFDVQLFHAWKRDNGSPQMVPLNEPDPVYDPSGPANNDLVDYDPYFINDPTWRKTHVTKPWSVNIYPVATGVRSSHSIAGYLDIGGGVGPSGGFDPSKLHIQRMWDSNWEDYLHTQRGINADLRSEWQAAPMYSSGVGECPEAWSGPTNYATGYQHGDEWRVTLSKQQVEENAEHHYHLHHPSGSMTIDPNTGAPDVETATGYDAATVRHMHMIDNGEIQKHLYDRSYFTYDGQNLAPKDEINASPWAPEVMFTSSGRLHRINPWRDTKTWIMRTDPQTGERYAAPCWFPWAPDAYGFYWRLPRHFNTVYQFRLWQVHSFALRSPIVSDFVDPYGDPVSSRRSMKYDGVVIDTAHPESIMTDFATPDDLEEVKKEILRITYLKGNKVQEVHTKDGVFDGREFGDLQARMDSSVSADRFDGNSGDPVDGPSDIE